VSVIRINGSVESFPGTDLAPIKTFHVTQLETSKAKLSGVNHLVAMVTTVYST
jgi:hypothetical protein